MIPILPYDRLYDFFNIDDKIAVYVNYDDDDPRKSDGTEGWYSGEVRNGYRHHDGCVSYRLDGIGPQDPERDESGNALDRNFEGHWGSGMAQPGVMKLEEWLYFKDHPDEYIEWFESAKERYNSNWEFNPINEYDIARFAKHLLETV